MLSLDAKELGEEVRSSILKKALVAETLIGKAGVNHRDVCPRNIFIKDYNHADDVITLRDTEIEMKIIDFNIAVVVSHSEYAGCEHMGLSCQYEYGWRSRLPNPIMERFSDMAKFSMYGWCSDEGREAEQWLWQHFHDVDRYVPVI